MTETQPQENPIDLDTPPASTQKDIDVNELIDLRIRKLSFARIGKIVGCSSANVQERLKPYKYMLEGVKAYKDNKADILAIHQQRIMSHLTEDKLKKAGPRDLVTCFGILYDKEQQERGGGDNKNQISIILSLACKSHEKIIEAEVVHKSVETVDKVSNTC